MTQPGILPRNGFSHRINRHRINCEITDFGDRRT